MATATVHKLDIKPRLECIECHATGEAPCDCNVGFRPISPRVAAAKAVAANPHKSSRAIAKEIGVSADTVDRARRSTARNQAVETRVGLDGKKRKVNPPNIHQFTEEDHDDPDAVEAANAANRRRHFLRCADMSVHHAKQHAGLRGAKPEEITPEVMKAFKEVIGAWTNLQIEMVKRAAKKGPPVLPAEVNKQTSKLAFVTDACSSIQFWLAENDRRKISADSIDSLTLFLHKAADQLLMVAQKLDGR